LATSPDGGRSDSIRRDLRPKAAGPSYNAVTVTNPNRSRDRGTGMSEMISRLLVAQSMGEYGALAGFGAVLDRFVRFTDDAVRNPRTSVPIVVAVLVVGYFLLRRRP